MDIHDKPHPLPSTACTQLAHAPAEVGVPELHRESNMQCAMTNLLERAAPFSPHTCFTWAQLHLLEMQIPRFRSRPPAQTQHRGGAMWGLRSSPGDSDVSGGPHYLSKATRPALPGSLTEVCHHHPLSQAPDLPSEAALLLARTQKVGAGGSSRWPTAKGMASWEPTVS